MMAAHASSGSTGCEERGDLNNAQKLTELLNITGRKLLELKCCMYKEAVESKEGAEGFDFATYMPLITRFQNEVATADLIKTRTALSESEVDSLVPKKQKYHYYLEEVKNGSFMKSGSDLDLTAANRRTDEITSGSIEDHLCMKPSDPKDLKREGAIDTNLNRFVNVGADVTDADPLSPLQKKTFGTFSPALEKSKVQKVTQTDQYSNGPKDEIKNMTSFQLGAIGANGREARTFKPSLPNKQEVGGIYTSDDGDFENYDSDVDKYKVVKKKLRNRARVYEDHFHLQNQSSNLKSPIFASTPKTSSSRINRSINDASMITGFGAPATVKPLQLTTERKKASESWFECKERCNVKLLQERLSLSESRASGSSFSLKDYLEPVPPTPTVVSPTRSSKSVRFSLSPSSRSSPRRVVSGMRSRANTSKYSSSSSDDSEVGFEDVQFPRVRS